MSRVDIYLTRHGETEWNVAERFQGRSDSPLTAKGVVQAQSLARRLAATHLDAIYSSPSGRAMRTADILRGQHDVPVVAVPELHEIAFGVWEGRTRAATEAEFPEACRRYLEAPHEYVPPQGGESYRDVRRRVLRFWRGIKKGDGGRGVLVVAHSVVLTLILAEVEGRPLARLWDPPFIEPASLSHLRRGESGWEICHYGDASHLRDA